MADQKMQIVITALDDTQRAFANLKGALNQVQGELKGVGSASKSAADGTKNITSAFGNLTSSLQSLGSMLGGLALANVLGQSIAAAKNLEKANVGLAVTARYAGAGMEEALTAAKRLASDGLMTVAEASQALQNLLGRGYSLQQSIDLMNRLKDSASFNRQAHLEFGQAIVGATEGLKNENSVLVDNAGVTKNVSIMWKEYAAQLGISVEQLTQAQKRQAEFNGIMRETEGQTGNTSLMMKTLQGTQAQLNQSILTTKETLGQALIPAFNNILTTLKPVISGIRDMVLWVETLGARFGGFVDKISLASKIVLSGKGLFSAAGQQEWKAGTSVIDANVWSIIDDIIKRSEGGSVPNIGKDTGKRRQDVVIPPKIKSLRSSSATTDPWHKAEADDARERYRYEEAAWNAAESADRAERAAYQKEADAWRKAELDDAREKLKYADDLAKKAYDASAFGGLMNGLTEYATYAAEIGHEINYSVVSAFQGMTDALTDFVTTGKASFGDLANSIISDMVRIAIQKSVTAPLANMATSFFSGLFAEKGMAIQGGVQKFASGGIVVRPTFFGMQNGAGLMGEAGPEAIMPLTRTASGHLGVRTDGGSGQALNVQVNVINQTSQPVTATSSAPQFDGKQFVISTIIENVRQNGVLRGMLAGGAY